MFEQQNVLDEKQNKTHFFECSKTQEENKVLKVESFSREKYIKVGVRTPDSPLIHL